MNDRGPGWDRALLVDGAGGCGGAASAARVYDYWLGGKDHLAVDRRVGDMVAEFLPWVVPTVRANRRFLVRAVRYLAGELGLDQFVDLGSGLPTAMNVHDVAQRARPGACTVYVDNDPVVLAHARALLACDARTVVVDGDLRDPGSILADPVLARMVDWSRPVAVLMVAVLHFLTDEDDPAATVAAFRSVMAPGGCVVVSHATPGPALQADAVRQAVTVYRELTGAPCTPRTSQELAGLLAGFDVLAPGLVPVSSWRPPGRTPPADRGPMVGQGLAGAATVHDAGLYPVLSHPPGQGPRHDRSHLSSNGTGGGGRRLADASTPGAGDGLLREVVRLVQDPRQDRDLGIWLAFLAMDAVDDVRRRLIGSGMLAPVTIRRIGPRRVQYLPTDPNAFAWPAVRVAGRLVRREPLGAADAVLVGLLQATGLLGRVLWHPDDHASGWAYAQSVRLALPSALAQVVATVEAAVGEAVLTSRIR
ncbi:MAG TPA: SAM-dependent methyltransferase [Kineosporiaceae bacterium]